MDPKKQPKFADRAKPQFRLGQEAVEGFDAVKPPKQEAPKPRISKVDANPYVINKPLMESYPEIADDKDERLLADVRRHWLGRVGIIFGGGLLIALLIGFMITVPSLLQGVGYNVDVTGHALIGFLTLVIGALIAVGTFIVLWIYNQNHMLITDQNIIEVRQINLFSKKVSHLNMINVEDVTVIKRGILQTAVSTDSVP